MSKQGLNQSLLRSKKFFLTEEENSHLNYLIDNILETQKELKKLKKETITFLEIENLLPNKNSNLAPVSNGNFSMEPLDDYRRLAESKEILLAYYKLIKAQNITIINLLKLLFIQEELNPPGINDDEYFDILGVNQVDTE